LPNLVSDEQKGFIKDRDIKDCICTASEAANLIHNKARGGNIALKIDITKAFDTLDWSFLITVLKKFGFNDIFCNWIQVILHSAFLSISINGKSHGYFNCRRGVRQGDPLSPLLFCLAEDVLSRSITKLVSEGKLNLIKGTRNFTVPSHCFYADDLMIYCKGNLAGLHALKDLFSTYALESGQVINNSKSTIYPGSISPRRLELIVQLMHFNIGTLPFSYLGVPIFKGKPKACHFQPIADRIKLKLASWKASLLSIAGRVQLVRSVIQSMLTYSISIYSWPVSLIKNIEQCIRNFIWSGEIDKRKLVTTAWKKVCRPFSQGGLNLRSLNTLNKASNLKLCWTLLHSQSSWAKLLRDRVIRRRKPIKYHIFSSIWSSIKEEFEAIAENSIWLLGNGENINFWNDNWCGTILSEHYNIPSQTKQLLTSTVSDYIANGHWAIPPQMELEFLNLSSIVNQAIISLETCPDSLLWQHTDSGSLELKDAYNFKMPQLQDLFWAKYIWSSDIPPSKSFMVWRLMHEKMPTDENLMTRGCAIPSMCNLCSKQVETTFHLFFQCDFARILWSWFAGCLNLTIQFTTMEDMWKLCDLNWSPQSKITVTAAIINLLNTIWLAKNRARFNDNLITWRAAIALIIANTSLTGNNTKKISSNSIRDFSFLKLFRISIHHSRAPVLKEVLWQPPLLNWHKCNIDGASTGNPGNASCGGVFRDHASDFIYAFAEPLGIASSFVAEISGAMRAIEIAFQHQWHSLWLETDSSSVVAAFNNPHNLVAWNLRNRWKNALIMVSQMNFMVTHIYREGNQVADLLANYGLTSTALTTWDEAPLLIRDSLESNKLGMPYFRICKF
jgi:ribonuclease HI